MDIQNAMISAVSYFLIQLDKNLLRAVYSLRLDVFTEFPSIGDIPTTILTIVKPIAYTIITICFLLEFIKSISRMDILKWESAFKIIAKFVIAKSDNGVQCTTHKNH